MVICAVPGCKNAFGKGHRLFRFPSDPKRRRIWIENCAGGKDWVPPTNGVICEIHFGFDQYENHRADGWRKLKPNAIPTLNFNLPVKRPVADVSEMRNEILRQKIYVSGDLFSVHDIADIECEEQMSISEISVIDTNDAKNKNVPNKYHAIKISKCGGKNNSETTITEISNEASTSRTEDEIPQLKTGLSATKRGSDTNDKRNSLNNFPVLKAMEIENIILPQELSTNVKNFDISGISIIPVTNVEKLNKANCSSDKNKRNSNDMENIIISNEAEHNCADSFQDDDSRIAFSNFSDGENETVFDGNLVNDTCSTDWWGKCSGHKELEDQVKKLKTDLQKVTSALNTFLSSDQISMLLNPTQMKWNRRSVHFGRRFMKNLGTNGYRFLRSTNYPLPPESLLESLDNVTTTK